MMPPETAELSTVLTDLDDLGFDVAIDRHPGPGWVRLDHYANDPAILDAGLRLAGTRFGLPTPCAMSGGWLVGDIAAAVTWPAAAALLTHDRLLVTDADDIYLPDPSSNRRLAARIAPSGSPRSSSTEAFATGIATTLHPLVEAVHRRSRRGRHALWGTVTDMVAAAFHRVGDNCGRPGVARQFADAVIENCATLVGGANWHDVTWSGGTEQTRIRNICCLWYRTPGGELCLTCPRGTERDRERTLERRAVS